MTYKSCVFINMDAVKASYTYIWIFWVTCVPIVIKCIASSRVDLCSEFQRHSRLLQVTITIQIHAVTYLSTAFVCCPENCAIAFAEEVYRFIFQTSILRSSPAVPSSDNFLSRFGWDVTQRFLVLIFECLFS